MLKVRVSGYSSNERARIFEVLDKEELEKKIEELDSREIYRMTYDMAQRYSFSGTAYTYIDAQSGEVVTTWLQQNHELHPFDSFYEIILCSIDTPVMDYTEEDLLSTEEEYEEYYEYRRKEGKGIEEYLEEKYGEEELNDRIENALDWYADEFSFDEYWIQEQLDSLYRRAVEEE